MMNLIRFEDDEGVEWLVNVDTIVAVRSVTKKDSPVMITLSGGVHVWYPGPIAQFITLLEQSFA